MKYIVTFYGSNPDNIPAIWPNTLQGVPDDYVAAEGETVMTLEQFNAYRAEHQAEYDAWEASKDNPKQRNKVIASIKAEAQSRIIAVTGGGEFWREKQMNMTARFSELLDIERDRELTAQEAGEKAALKNFWAVVKAIRTRSNTLESDYLSGLVIDINAGWP